jgi:hypothetical protein
LLEGKSFLAKAPSAAIVFERHRRNRDSALESFNASLKYCVPELAPLSFDQQSAVQKPDCSLG